MKKFLLVAMVTVLALGLVAFSAPVKITFWHAMTKAHKDALTYLAQKFMLNALSSKSLI